jgi:HD-GYP domain-containing protein (c-di-GMP phosphodiesterase class II)
MIAMNLKNRFRLVIFCMVALPVSIAVVAAIGIQYTNVHIQQAIGMDDLVVNLYELQILNSEYVETPSERVKQQWQTKYSQIRSKLIKQLGIPDDVKDAFNGLQQIFERLTSLPDVLPEIEVSQRLREQVATTLTLESQRVIDWAADISRQEKDGIVPLLMLIGAVMLAIMLVVALTAITIMIVTARHIFLSVNRLKEGAEEIASGSLGFQVKQAGNDEIATLATAINQMSLGLMESYKNLQEQKVQLETEMAERHMIHQALKIKTVELEKEIEKRTQAEEQLRDTLESLRKSMSAAIQVMVATVEARDPYTAGHQIRSADLARAIATEMGLPREKIEGLRMAGSIHDIGKISIPAEILSKPTKLSEIEFSLIKAHAQRGYEMLKDVESSWPLAEIVYQHHERMDGSGYPRHLKGDDICIEARILCVADVVEAMASHRPYRPGLGIDAALAEIEKNRGICYDDAVANACLRLFLTPTMLNNKNL